MRIIWICSIVLLLLTCAAAAPAWGAEVAKDAVKQAAATASDNITYTLNQS